MMAVANSSVFIAQILISAVGAQFSYRSKVERLIGRMKGRLKMNHLYKRGLANIRGHVLKFYNLMHILANVTGSYGV